MRTPAAPGRHDRDIASRPAGPPRGATEFAAAVVLTGLNLRPLFGSLPPLLDDVQDDLGLSGTAAGLLITGPLLCLGILAPLGPRIARRYPVERLLVAAAVATAIGTAARGLGGPPAPYAGTLVAGAAVAPPPGVRAPPGRPR